MEQSLVRPFLIRLVIAAVVSAIVACLVAFPLGLYAVIAITGDVGANYVEAERFIGIWESIIVFFTAFISFFIAPQKAGFPGPMSRRISISVTGALITLVLLVAVYEFCIVIPQQIRGEQIAKEREISQAVMDDRLARPLGCVIIAKTEVKKGEVVEISWASTGPASKMTNNDNLRNAATAQIPLEGIVHLLATDSFSIHNVVYDKDGNSASCSASVTVK